MEAWITEGVKALFEIGVELYKGRGDSDEVARQKAEALIQKAPRELNLDDERIAEIAESDQT